MSKQTILNRTEAKEFLIKMGVHPFLVANALAGGHHVDYAKGFELIKDGDNYILNY